MTHPDTALDHARRRLLFGRLGPACGAERGQARRRHRGYLPRLPGHCLHELAGTPARPAPSGSARLRRRRVRASRPRPAPAAPSAPPPARRVPSPSPLRRRTRRRPMPDEFHISSLVVHSRPERVHTVADRLRGMAGVAVYGGTEAGKSSSPWRPRPRARSSIASTRSSFSTACSPPPSSSTTSSQPRSRS